MTKLIGQAELEARLWDAMEVLRGAVPQHDYKDYVGVLLVLKRLSDQFEEHQNLTSHGDDWDQKWYSDNRRRFYVPERARWKELVVSTDQGAAVDRATRMIQDANVGLEGIFWGVEFARLDHSLVRRLLAIFTTLSIGDSTLGDPEDLGVVFEKVLRRTAAEEGRNAGEYATPPVVTDLMVRLTAPRPRMRVYDPACGIGSFLTATAKFIHEQFVSGTDDLVLTGRERNIAVWAHCRMNLLLRGLPLTGIELGDSLSLNGNPERPPKQFDRVLTHPPFGLRDWSDGRNGSLSAAFEFGPPARTNGDYAWLQHAYSALNVGGVAAVLMPRGVLFRQGADGEVRRRMLEAGVIDGVVVLPGGLVYGSSTPVVALMLSRHAPNRSRSNLFIVDGTRDLSGSSSESFDESWGRSLADVYREGVEIPKVSRWVSYGELEQNDFVLTSERYLQGQQERAGITELKYARARVRNLEKRRAGLETKMDDLLDQLGLLTPIGGPSAD